MISIENLTIRFGGFELFSNISLLINSKDKIGLVGKNGAGKTSLLNTICGNLQPTEGKVIVPSDIKFGYLPQQMIHKNNKTIYDETSLAFEEILKIQKKIREINIQIEVRNDYESDSYMNLVNKLSEFEERLEIIGGDSYHVKIEKVLFGLGFNRNDFKKQTSELSGGWRMRIELAKILLKNPDILLLDEPTNHLDIESIQWLESFIKDYKGAMILISHDKAFLDNTTHRTIEISLGRIYDYKANYSKYLIVRKDIREKQLASYYNQQKKIEDTKKFIERFRYKASKAVQVQSRIKQLEKIDIIEVEEEDKAKININFPPAPRAGTIIIETENLTKNYGNICVLKNINLIIERGEKVAFVGKNGEGKTTLSRIVVGELEYTGNIKLGNNLKIGYFAQNQDELMDQNLTVFETIDNIAVGDIRTKIRDILGAFLFSGDDIDKKVSVLSGGEKSRLAIAKLLLEPYNLLVLDEPTNHLDIRSKEILKQALIKYDGTLIIVSHDRDFLTDLCTRTYEFKNQNIRNYPGDIYDFLRQKQIDCLKHLEKKDKPKTSGNKSKKSNKETFLLKKNTEKKIRKLDRQIKDNEFEIDKIEKELAKINELLSNPTEAGDLINDKNWFDKYESLKKDLNKKMNEWEKNIEIIEKLKKEYLLLQ